MNVLITELSEECENHRHNPLPQIRTTKIQKKMNNIETLTAEEARRRGMRPLTSVYGKNQEWMLENAINDLAGSRIALVEFAAGVEIWRHQSEILSDS